MLWRPEGLELRIPLHLGEGALASFATKEVWSKEPLASTRHEIWSGWLALASPTLLEDIDPTVLWRVLDTAAKRAGDVRSREQAAWRTSCVACGTSRPQTTELAARARALSAPPLARPSGAANILLTARQFSGVAETAI